MHPITRKSVFIILLLLANNAFLFANSDYSKTNYRDDLGRRQGYWIIKGHMLNDPSYSPEAVVEEGSYVDDRKEGLWKKYYTNGKLNSEITYTMDRPDGPYAVYYDNGKLEEKGTWLRNKNTGEFKRYYSNGNLQQAFLFSDKGLRNGIQTYYHENGAKALEVNIVEGKEEGKMRRWNESGKLVEEKEMYGGILIAGSLKRYDNDEKPEIAGGSGSAPIQSKPTQDKTNAAEKFRPDGYNVLYDTNNHITQVGEFKNGRLWDGKWHRYGSDGILKRVEIYKNGTFVGNGVIEDTK
jgi:antitoxin component YwqK of YwqJK toxin-antitoxin module